MYIYNVTINIDESVHYDWRFWIEDHINEVLDTGKFISAKMTEVLVEEEMGGRHQPPAGHDLPAPGRGDQPAG